ncbi:hypothetical protein [Hymenobacter psoromatis]|uniref:hypothetical protein n=1 Tax=Hymenobacter psoromatis TaxID=1484116 RepID=UPI001CBC6022|nr:hypothetical protein [Hymenobacter psoromatis]
MLPYLTLRLRLLGRLLRELGWLRLALLLIMLALVLLQALAALRGQPRAAWLVPPLLAWLLLSAHRQRTDTHLLASATPDFRPWLAAEYALLALPVALLLLAVGVGGPALLTLALAPLAAWAPPAREAAARHRWRSLFRSEAFEWVAGMRAANGLLIWLVLVGLATWQRASSLAPVAGLVAWLLVVLACYGTPEPVTMLALAARSPRQFLRRRLGLGLGYAAATALPFGILLGVGPAGWGAALAVSLFWLALVAMLILTKYAFYPNISHIRTTQSLVLALSLLGAGHPAYPPLMLVSAAGLVWQSRRRVGQVLGF